MNLGHCCVLDHKMSLSCLKTAQFNQQVDQQVAAAAQVEPESTKQ